MKQILYYGYECIGDTGINLLLSEFKKNLVFYDSHEFRIIKERYDLLYFENANFKNNATEIIYLAKNDYLSLRKKFSNFASFLINLAMRK